MNFKRLITSFVCTFTILMALSVSVYADRGVVTGDVVNVRQEPSINSGIITKVYSGNSFEIVSLGKDWTEIEYKFGQTGFIYNEFFKPVESYKICTVNAVNVNLRAGAGTDAKVLKITTKGDNFRVKNVDGNWVEVLYSGQSAYICKDFVTVKEITLEDGETTPEEPEEPGIAEIAANYLGKPYVYGASGPNAFDCSGFTKYVYQSLGITLPRVAASQATVGTPVSRDNLKEGDLVFFANGGYIDHVGIYVGNGKMIHAGSSSASICYADLSTPYFAARYAGARRIIS